MNKPVRINFESLRPCERKRLLENVEPSGRTETYEGVWLAYPWTWNGRPVEVWRFSEHAHRSGLPESAGILAA